MKKYLLTGVTIVLCSAAVFSCGGKNEATKTEQTGAVSGEQIYADNCMICHGKDGKAGMSGATDLSSSTLSHEAAVHVVTNGRNGMRPFTELTKEEIEAVVSHIETLRK
jgi:cytochrome c6